MSSPRERGKRKKGKKKKTLEEKKREGRGKKKQRSIGKREIISSCVSVTKLRQVFDSLRGCRGGGRDTLHWGGKGKGRRGGGRSDV